MRWLNPNLPEALQGAVFLCYIQAVLILVTSLGFLGPLGIVIVVGLAAGGLGIANEKKWGYALAIGVAVAQVALFVSAGGLSQLGDVRLLINFAFDVLLVVLLLHPTSRGYQRTWFR